MHVHSATPRIPEVWRHQRLRIKPNGQPPESSQLIASWSVALIRDTGAGLLDMNPDCAMADNLRRAIESDGDRVADWRLWRLGPGHLGAAVWVVTLTLTERCEADYRAKLARFRSLSHLTIEVRRAA